MVSAPTGLRCRQIDGGDIAAVATLLTRGFPQRDRPYWLRAFAQLTEREPPPGLPKYGYLMESDGVPVGVILLIFSTMRVGDALMPRCNFSSWYVEPKFRRNGSLLLSEALQHQDATYLNISPARHTWAKIEAHGFSRYCDGIFLAVPMLNGLFRRTKLRVFATDRQPDVDFDPLDQQLLLRHAAHGCISLWCSTPEYAYPFVFRARRVRTIIPCAQLIYCRNVAEFVRFAGPIGRFLASHGRPFVIVDANGPIPGLPGIYRRDRPKYFKGPMRPRLGDLAYTEYALFGL
jgi:hypothetical protein